MGRRVLVTGLGTFWGGLVAQQLEADPDVEVIVGLDTTPPEIELERTEFVRVDQNYSILSRIVAATKVDTIIHTFLVMNSNQMSSRAMKEINVIGTMNLFAAASAAGSTVERVVVKSSSLVYGAHREDPAFFREDMHRTGPARTSLERSILAVEDYVRDFAVDNPHVTVSMLRFSNVLGPTIVTPFTKLLQLPLVPNIFGFDPRFQFVHEEDVVRSILFVLDHDLAGIYNVAGDGMLPWSEVATICGKRTVPLPPLVTAGAALPLRALGYDMPPEVLELLRYGRGVDGSKLVDTGFQYRFTSAGTVEHFAQALRLRSTVGDGGGEPEYTYQADVEQFFKHSPAVIREPSS
jgi:UDP-glucose 4-epimerase